MFLLIMFLCGAYVVFMVTGLSYMFIRDGIRALWRCWRDRRDHRRHMKARRAWAKVANEKRRAFTSQAPATAWVQRERWPISSHR